MSDEDKNQDYLTIGIPLEELEGLQSNADEIVKVLAEKYLREGAVSLDDFKEQLTKNNIPYNEALATKIFEDITPHFKKLDVLRGMVNCECPACHHKYSMHIDKNEIY